jgi:hypothetical protein
MSRPYESLNDAAETTGINGLRPGKTEIWFMNDKGWETFSRGPALALKTDHALPIGHDVGRSGTHRLLGTIQATTLGGIFMAMQGESWSPHGEGNALVRANGLHHSSMSVGDIIVLPNGAGHMVDSVGFFELPNNAAEQKAQVRKAQGDISPLLRRESAGMRDTLRGLEEGAGSAGLERHARRIYEKIDAFQSMMGGPLTATIVQEEGGQAEFKALMKACAAMQEEVIGPYLMAREGGGE